MVGLEQLQQTNTPDLRMGIRKASFTVNVRRNLAERVN